VEASQHGTGSSAFTSSLSGDPPKEESICSMSPSASATASSGASKDADEVEEGKASATPGT
jgi:hypothetical protein